MIVEVSMSNSLDFDKIPIRDYSVAHTPIRKKNNKSKIIIIIILITIMFVSLFFVFHTNEKKKTVIQKSTSKTKSLISSNPNSTSSSIYSSVYYNLTLNLPNGWSVINDNKLSLSVVSPVQDLIDTSNNKVNGRIFLSITPTGQVPSGLDGKDALEVIESLKVSYTQPTSSQLAQSYISLVQYQSTIQPNGLDGIFVTGNSGYTQSQIVPFSRLKSLNPTIVIYFQSCSDSKCSKANNLTINDSMWNNSDFQNTIINLIKSLSLS